MYTYLKNMEARMSEDQKDMLRRIYEPTVVGEVPPFFINSQFCVLPDGEIRAYGYLYHDITKREMGIQGYQSSVDGGISWTLHHATDTLNICTYIEKAGIYLAPCQPCPENNMAICVYRSTIGPNDPNPEVVVVNEQAYWCTVNICQSAYSDRIWFAGHKGGTTEPAFFYSDDFGLTWTTVKLTRPYFFEKIFPHKGLRWSTCGGTEPYVGELAENKLLMLIRSPMDSYYQAMSYDGGETWTEPEPSFFYGTNTNSYILHLSSGRTVCFWNNTAGMAQPNHKATKPYPGDDIVKGECENAFTNRDAAHAAITDDGGKTFHGFREIMLNPVRNNSDFRYVGTGATGGDKSSQDIKAVELPFNKILVMVGQHRMALRKVIFDADWLYETTRKEDFLAGVSNLTTHTYTKSISGCFFVKVGNGHCAWNHTYGAYPMPDPDGGVNEVLNVRKHHDDRLLNDIGGVVWNFPMSRKGRVTVDLKIAEKQARFTLTDRWYNTCDPYAAIQSPFWFELDVTDTGCKFTKVVIDYDVDKGMAEVSLDGEHFFKVAMRNPCITGISYLMLQCATDGDSEGFYVRSMEKE